jgi:hypothetical protein
MAAWMNEHPLCAKRIAFSFSTLCTVQFVSLRRRRSCLDTHLARTHSCCLECAPRGEVGCARVGVSVSKEARSLKKRRKITVARGEKKIIYQRTSQNRAPPKTQHQKNPKQTLSTQKTFFEGQFEKGVFKSRFFVFLPWSKKCCF